MIRRGPKGAHAARSSSRKTSGGVAMGQIRRSSGVASKSIVESGSSSAFFRDLLRSRHHRSIFTTRRRFQSVVRSLDWGISMSSAVCATASTLRVPSISRVIAGNRLESDGLSAFSSVSGATVGPIALTRTSMVGLYDRLRSSRSTANTSWRRAQNGLVSFQVGTPRT